jgi:hypothetical protein
VAVLKPDGGKSGQIPRPKVKYCSLQAAAYIMVPACLNDKMNWLDGGVCAVHTIHRATGLLWRK